MKTLSLIAVVLVFAIIQMSAQQLSSIRMEGLFLKSNDLREVAVSYETLEDAKKRGVVLVDLSMMSEVATFQGKDVGFNKTYFIKSGKTIAETLVDVQRESNKVIDLGRLVRVFLLDRAFMYRHSSVPVEIAQLKLTAGDVLIISKSRL